VVAEVAGLAVESGNFVVVRSSGGFGLERAEVLRLRSQFDGGLRYYIGEREH